MNRSSRHFRSAPVLRAQGSSLSWEFHGAPAKVVTAISSLVNDFGVVELTADGFDSSMAGLTGAWLGAALYASRAHVPMILVINAAADHPDDADIENQLKLAAKMSSTWPSRELASLGDELRVALRTWRGDAPIEILQSDASRSDFTMAPGGLRLTASTAWPLVATGTRRRVGFRLRLLEAVVSNLAEHEELILHEILAASDYLSPLHGEELPL